MSTFMACAAVDLDPTADPKPLLDLLVEEAGQPPLAAYATKPLSVWIRPTGDGLRVSLLADYGNIWLGQTVVTAAARLPQVRRGILALDHDEYGIEHLIIARVGGRVCRLQHVYVHPDGEPNEEEQPSLLEVPAHSTVDVAADGTVNNPASWSAVAALYGVPNGAVEAAGRYAAVAHEGLGVVFTPFEPWWKAVEVAYPGDLGEPDVVLLELDNRGRLNGS